MDCETVGEILDQYHEGECSLKENREALAHIKECGACRESLLRILYDLDLAAYTAFFEEIEPPASFTDKVLDALPGATRKPARRKTAARRRTPSSSKLSPVKGDRKSGVRRGRPSSGGALKPTRKTGTMRRRTASKDQQSGLFLQDQIFGSQEKKSGLIITYCEDCGERIDPDDFDTGVAVYYQNASYCKKCKLNVEGLEADKPAPQKGRKKGVPARAPTRSAPAARPPSGRLPSAHPKKAMNLPMVGGAIMGAAVLLIVAVIVVMKIGGGPAGDYTVSKSARTKAESSRTEEGAATQDGVAVEGAAKEPADENAIDAELKAMAEMKKQKEEEEKEKERFRQVPHDKIKEWRVKSDELLAKRPPDFKEALRLWNSWYANAVDGKITDPVTKKTVKFDEEQLARIQNERNRVIQKRTRWFEGELELIKNKVHAMANAAPPKWDDARKMVKDIPPGWEVDFEKGVRDLEGLLSDIDLWEQNWKRKMLADIKEKAKRDIEVGKWVELVLNQEDLVANWYHQPPDKCEVEKDEDDHTVLRLEGDRTCVFTQHGKSKTWFNYEVEFDVRGTAGLVIFFREPAKDGKRVYIALKPLPAWKKIRAKVDNVVLELYVDGKMVHSSPASLRSGGLYLMALGAGSVKMRNPKIKINKTN